jgi:major membrane immunogen (membrane-anchored lipoprotein)
MAYKQKGCTPITAKLQKTTKGGMVQQPLLNMGAPVKMKSPAKQGGRPRVEAKAEEPKNNKDQIDRLKLEVSSMTDTLENYKKKGGKIAASDANYLQKKKEELASISPKNNTKKDIAIEKVAGGYFGNTLGKDKPKDSNRIDFPIET